MAYNGLQVYEVAEGNLGGAEGSAIYLLLVIWWKKETSNFSSSPFGELFPRRTA